MTRTATYQALQGAVKGKAMISKHDQDHDGEAGTADDEAGTAKVEITGEIGKPLDPPRRRAMIEWTGGR